MFNALLPVSSQAFLDETVLVGFFSLDTCIEHVGVATCWFNCCNLELV